MSAKLVLRDGVLKRLRETRSIPSDEVLARMIGVDRGTLRRVECGAQPSGTFVANTVAAFGLGIGELFEVVVDSKADLKAAA